MSRVLRRIGRGEFADAFDLEDGRVLKAFRRSEDGGKIGDYRAQISFAAECRAYELFSEEGEIAPYLPHYFGGADPATFALADVGQYAPRCGILLEHIPGEPHKLMELPPRLRRRAEAVITAMLEHLRTDPWDASCFVPGTRTDLTIIDFATPTHLLSELDLILAKHGDVPSHMRHLLGLPQ